MSSRTVLVTGGAGYVGSHACKLLAQSGYTPVTYDNLSRGHAEHVRWGPLEIGDVLDRDRLREVIRRYRPSAAMHFAAFAYVGESVARPLEYHRLNVGGLVNVVDELREIDCGRIVFSSTCATYGIPVRVPIAESDPQIPISPYGASKLYAESVLRDAGVAHGIGWMALRYFNAAGDDPELQTGEWHDPEPHVIPCAVRAALHQDVTFQILGNDHATYDGTAIRDYVHVMDLARAHVLALEHLERGGASSALNLGSEKGTSVLELVRSLEDVVGKKLDCVISPRRPGDPAAAVADSRAAYEILGWKPQVATIAEILETAVRWHRHAPHTL